MKVILLSLLVISIHVSHAQNTTAKKQNSATQNKSKPDFKVALKFINDYVKPFTSKGKKGMSVEAWIKTNPLLTPTFKAKYKAICDAADPEFGLEFDPITSSQDEPESFIISKTDPIQGYVIVSGVGQPTFKVILRVILFNNKWLVDGSGVVNIPESKQIQP